MSRNGKQSFSAVALFSRNRAGNLPKNGLIKSSLS